MQSIPCRFRFPRESRRWHRWEPLLRLAPSSASAARCLRRISSKVCVLSLGSSSTASFAVILRSRRVRYERDPAEGRQFEDSRGDQDRDPCPVAFGSTLFSKGVHAPKRRPSSMAQSSSSATKFLRREFGPNEPAINGEKIFIDCIPPVPRNGIVHVRNAIEFSGDNTRDRRLAAGTQRTRARLRRTFSSRS